MLGLFWLSRNVSDFEDPKRSFCFKRSDRSSASMALSLQLSLRSDWIKIVFRALSKKNLLDSGHNIMLIITLLDTYLQHVGTLKTCK